MNLSEMSLKVVFCARVEKKMNAAVKAQEHQIFYVTLGGAIFTIGDKTYKLGSGGFVFVPAGAEVTVKCDGTKLVCIRFTGNLDAPLDRPFALAGLTFFEDKMLEMTDVFLSETKTSGALLTVALTDVLIRVYEEVDEEALPSRLVRSLDEYIRENATSDISNTEIAAVFGYHPYYISQMFKTKMGVTLRQYVAAYRFRLAKTMLLNTDKSIAEIAEASGFHDASYFTKSFKAAFGLTPKEFRGTER